MKKDIVIVGGARDYHVMDWYRTVAKVAGGRRTILLTDLIDSEGYDVLLEDTDRIERLFVIDKLLFRSQSRFGNIWRNIVKLLVIPVQVMRLRKFIKRNPNSLLHAQPMYYMIVCWLAGLAFIGTPQGSEILVRPLRSALYRYFARRGLRAAKRVTVDSENMKRQVYELAGIEATIIQNGIATNDLLSKDGAAGRRRKICSIRGFTPLYRIDEILKSRDRAKTRRPLEFCYPFWDEGYRRKVLTNLQAGDKDLGRLPRAKMYELLRETLLVISIPQSDSSPRSVYEAIFAGCCVAAVHNPWIDSLPNCMRVRLYILDLNSATWYDDAIEYAERITKQRYRPSDEALCMFDQTRTMQRAVQMLYT